MSGQNFTTHLIVSTTTDLYLLIGNLALPICRQFYLGTFNWICQTFYLLVFVFVSVSLSSEYVFLPPPCMCLTGCWCCHSILSMHQKQKMTSEYMSICQHKHLVCNVTTGWPEFYNKQGESTTVWQLKSRQISWKVAQKWFH